MAGHAGSTTGTLYADITLIRSKGKVKVTGLLDFRKLQKPCMHAGSDPGLSGLSLQSSKFAQSLIICSNLYSICIWLNIKICYTVDLYLLRWMKHWSENVSGQDCYWLTFSTVTWKGTPTRKLTLYYRSYDMKDFEQRLAAQQFLHSLRICRICQRHVTWLQPAHSVCCTCLSHATGYASQHIWCLSQARINWEDCGRKGIWRKNGGWWR